MNQWRIGRYVANIWVTILFVLHIFGIVRLPLLDRLEHLFYDYKIQISFANAPDSRIVIVDIDEKSLAGVGRWPWGRDRVAELVDTLFDHYRIGVLGMDVVFSEPDDGSGLSTLESLAKGPLSDDSAFLSQFYKLRPSLMRDNLLARSLSDRPVVLGYYFKQTAIPGAVDFGSLPPSVMTIKELGRDHIPFIKAVGFGANIKPLQEAASIAGFFDNSMVSEDGIVRKAPLLQEYQGAIYPSLALGVVRTILGDPPLTFGIQADAGLHKVGARTGLEWIGLGPHKIPVEAQGSILIPFRGRYPSFPYVSAVDVLNRVVDKKILDTAIVLVGSTSAGLMDLRSTPVQNLFPGVEIHANIISGMLDGSIKSYPAKATLVHLFFLLAIGMVFTIIVPWLTVTWGGYLTSLLVLLLFWANLLAWQKWDTVLPLATPLSMILTLFILNSLFGAFVETRERKKTNRIYGRHIPAEFVDEMLRKGESMAPDGELREMTVLYATVRDFPALEKSLPPHELIPWIHDIKTPLTEILHQNLGTLDHYMGGSTMAFWGAPLEDPHHAKNAVTAVLEMVRRMEALEDEFQTKGWPTVKCELGLDSGSMTVGDIGSKFRKDFSVLGGPVHSAVWLNSLAGSYGASILVGEETKRLVSGMVFRELDRVIPEHGEGAVSLYQPVGFRDEIRPELRSQIEAFHKAVAHFRKQEWDLAEKGFVNLLQRDPEDRIHQLYLNRINAYKKNPPGDDWDGSSVPPKREMRRLSDIT